MKGISITRFFFLGNERDNHLGGKKERKNCHLLIWSFGRIKVGNYELSDIFCLVLDNGPPICTNKFDFRSKDRSILQSFIEKTNKQTKKEKEKVMAHAPLLYKQAETTVSWPQVYHWVVRRCHYDLNSLSKWITSNWDSCFPATKSLSKWKLWCTYFSIEALSRKE